METFSDNWNYSETIESSACLEFNSVRFDFDLVRIKFVFHLRKIATLKTDQMIQMYAESYENKWLEDFYKFSNYVNTDQLNLFIEFKNSQIWLKIKFKIHIY